MTQRSPRGMTQISPGLPTSQVLPPDMADYRLASLAKSRRRENQEDTSGFITLEALMLSRQEEERRAQNMLHEAPPPPATSSHRLRPNTHEINRPMQPRVTPRAIIPSPGSLTQPRPSHSRSTSAFGEERENGVTVARRSSFNTPSRLQRQIDLENQDYRDGSPEKLWIDSLRRNDKKYPPTPRHIHQINPQAPVLAKLKKAALYQPPPVAPLDTPGGGESMQLAFEMTLDQSEPKRRYAKVTPTPASRLKNLFTGRSEHNPQQKTLLGSPRLHRAIFRGSVNRADSTGEIVNSPSFSPPQDTVMEIQITNRSTPDYPGLEYPPVFEPGTYSLADASSVLRHRMREAR